MKFTPEEAMSLIRDFAMGLDDYKFCERHLVKESGSRYAVSAYEPKKALEPLVAMADAARGLRGNEEVPFPEDGCGLLKDWVTAWISPEGWTRLLAARRQRKSKENRRSGSTKVTPVATADMAAYYLSEMAQAVGFNRSAFVDKLVHHLRWDEEGQAFMKRFNLQLLAEQRKEGRQLLIEAFRCTQGHLDRELVQAVGAGQERHDLVVQSAQKVGKVKLAKLAALAHKVAPENVLRFALLPQDQLAGRSPLMALSEGEPLTALKKTTHAA